MLRLFLAFPGDERAHRALDGAERLWTPPPGARPVPPARRHLTALFLGERAPGQLQEIDRLVTAHWEDRGAAVPRQVVLDRWLTLPPGPRARTLVLAGSAPPAWQGWQAALARALEAGRPARFLPHVTLARLAGPIPLPRRRPPAVPWPLTALVLFESRLTASGPRYTVLRSWGPWSSPRGEGPPP